MLRFYPDALKRTREAMAKFSVASKAMGVSSRQSGLAYVAVPIGAGTALATDNRLEISESILPTFAFHGSQSISRPVRAMQDVLGEQLGTQSFILRLRDG